MALTRLNISLPESMKRFVDERMNTLGFTSVSGYFRELVRRDQQLSQSRFEDRFEKQDTGSFAPRPFHSTYRNALFGDDG